MTAPVLEIRDLSVEVVLPHGLLHAVRGVSLTVAPGESVAIVGESGSGKSLTLRALLGLLSRPVRASSGTILIDGVDITDLPSKQLHRKLTDTMSMIFQDPLAALNPLMRVGDQIAEVPLRRLGKSRTQAKVIALDLMTKTGLNDPEQIYGVYPHQLSGGMRQRIGIAIALSAQPRLILADEPTTALDVTTQAQVLNVLRDLQRDEYLGLLLVSHDLAVVSETCSRLYVMYGGKVVESGPVVDLINEPKHPYTFALLRSVPDPDHRVTKLIAIEGEPPDMAQPLTGCCFAPRCPFVTEKCREQEPPLGLVANAAGDAGRRSACWHVNEAQEWAAIVSEQMGDARP